MSQTQSISPHIPAVPRQAELPRLRLAGMAGLAVLTLATRIPFASKVLYHWDLVNFAYAMSEFNLVKEQPQPPGYILYVWLCRLLASVLHDPQTVMVTISIAASVGAVVAMYLLGEAIYNARVGWLSAIFLAASPLFWFYNEIALPHSVDAFLVIVSVLLLYKSMQGERRYVIPAVLVLAIAGGVRQQTIVFLAPALLFAFRKIGWKLFIGAGVVGVIACLAWFIPLLWLSGGLNQYLTVMGNFSDRFQKTTSIFMGAGLWGIRRNVTKLILYSAFGWSIFFVPAVFWVVRRVTKLWKARPGERSVFIGLWILPSVLFYLLIHMGQQGLTFVFLPALILVSAAALELIFQASAPMLWASALVLTLLSSAIFLFFPEYPLGAGGQRLLTRQTLVNSDRYYQTRIDTIRQDFDPQNTLILAQNWHHVGYYLPGYRVIPFNLGAKWEVDEGAPVNNPTTTVQGNSEEWGLPGKDAQIILFDPDLVNFATAETPLKVMPLAGQELLTVIEFPQGVDFAVDADSFGLENK